MIEYNKNTITERIDILAERVILHSDLNAFFASVECLYHPELRDKPVAVCGDPELRNGIVLAKNDLAKKTGIKTGETIGQAKQKCIDLIVLPPHFSLYQKFGCMARSIYADYASQIEPFGIDEAWLDVTGSKTIYGDGRTIADAIRKRIKAELGITVSVGVSYNKVFAKLGSDMKKPDATTVISTSDYKEKVWPLPVQDLLYVGRATHYKLNRRNILTIGDLAQRDVRNLVATLGKWGKVLHTFANGLDSSPVVNRLDFLDFLDCLSISNSKTTPRDLVNDGDVHLMIFVLADSVATRLRESGFRCRGVQIYIRDIELISFERQSVLKSPTNISTEIAAKAMAIFRANYNWARPIRSIGVKAINLVSAEEPFQTNMFVDECQRIKQEQLEKAIDALRQRYGHYCIHRAVLLEDRELNINPKDDHTIHPVGFLKPGTQL